MRKLLFVSIFVLIGTFTLANINETPLEINELLTVEVIEENNKCTELMADTYETMIALGFSEEAACRVQDILGTVCDSFDN